MSGITLKTAALITAIAGVAGVVIGGFGSGLLLGVSLAIGVLAFVPMRLRNTDGTLRGDTTTSPLIGALFVTMSVYLIVVMYADLPAWFRVTFIVAWIAVVVVYAANWVKVHFTQAAAGTTIATLALAVGATFTGGVVANEFASMPTFYDGEQRVVQVDSGEIALAAFPDGTGDAGQIHPEYEQYLVSNPKSNFVLEGLLTEDQRNNLPYEKQVGLALDGLAQHARHNVFLLTSSSVNAGLWDDPNNVGVLLTPVDEHGKQYLSQQGQDLYANFIGFINKAVSQGGVSLEEVDPSETNTGFSEGGVSQSSGITGDLLALVLRVKDEKNGDKVVKVLVRCGNPVFPPQAKVVPEGHTDELPPRPKPERPKPSATTTPPPPTSETPTPSTETPPPPTSTTTVPPETTTPPPTTTVPPTTPPTTTKPPTTTPPVTTTTPKPVCPWNPELPPGHPDCKKPKNPEDDPPKPDGNDTPQPSPSGLPETTPPVEPNPLDPTVTPGEEAPGEVEAPSATPTPPSFTPPPLETSGGAAPSENPNTEVITRPGANGHATQAPAPATEDSPSTAGSQESAPQSAPSEPAEEAPPADVPAEAGLFFALPLGWLVRRKLTK